MTVIHESIKSDTNAKMKARDVSVYYGDKKAIDEVSIGKIDGRLEVLRNIDHVSRVYCTRGSPSLAACVPLDNGVRAGLFPPLECLTQPRELFGQ